MFATWILCLFFADDRAYLTVEAGCSAAKVRGASAPGRGYRTELSMASQEAWDYAQQICSKRYILWRHRDGNRRAVAHQGRAGRVVVSLYVFTAVIGLFEVVAVILLIASVETSLRKRYAPKTAA